jgi:hypothetical protein
MHTTRRSLAIALMIAFMGVPLRAVDRWETVSSQSPAGDDDFNSSNELRHGTIQTAHDFHSPDDQDWMRAKTFPHRSYEARTWSGTTRWRTSDDVCSGCPRLDRVDVDGTVLTSGTDDGVMANGGALSQAVRWIAEDQTTFLRALNTPMGVGLSYDLVFYDTTYFLPRFNNSSSQVTVVIVQNTQSWPISGQIVFYDNSGTYLHSQPFALGPHATLVFNTSSVPVLRGLSGSAAVAHTAGYGGLAGKGVALEPATGFTFDTVLSSLPY